MITKDTAIFRYRSSLSLLLAQSRHVKGLAFYLIIVVGHAAEQIVQMTQFFLLGWPRMRSLGMLGYFYPALIRKEILHFTYNGLQLLGLLLLLSSFHRRARRWWLVTIGFQAWHFFEHILL